MRDDTCTSWHVYLPNLGTQSTTDYCNALTAKWHPKTKHFIFRWGLDIVPSDVSVSLHGICAALGLDAIVWPAIAYIADGSNII